MNQYRRREKKSSLRSEIISPPPEMLPVSRFLHAANLRKREGLVVRGVRGVRERSRQRSAISRQPRRKEPPRRQG